MNLISVTGIIKAHVKQPIAVSVSTTEGASGYGSAITGARASGGPDHPEHSSTVDSTVVIKLAVEIDPQEGSG